MALLAMIFAKAEWQAAKKDYREKWDASIVFLDELNDLRGQKTYEGGATYPGHRSGDTIRGRGLSQTSRGGLGVGLLVVKNSVALT